MHQTFMIPRALTGMRKLEAPYHFPRIVHQTVKNKSNLACEVVDGMASWRDKNPGWDKSCLTTRIVTTLLLKNIRRCGWVIVAVTVHEMPQGCLGVSCARAPELGWMDGWMGHVTV